MLPRLHIYYLVLLFFFRFRLAATLFGCRLLFFVGRLFPKLVLLVVMLNICTHRGHFLVKGLNLTCLVTYSGKERIEFLVLDRKRILLLYTYYEIGQDVHIIGKCLERCLIWAETAMHLTIGQMFCRHIEQMVGCLQIVPVLLQAAVITETYALCYRVQLAESLILQFVTEPCGSIAGLIRP